MNNEEDVNVPNSHCVAKFNRRDCRDASVATFKNNRVTSTIVNSQMGVAHRNKPIICIILHYNMYYFHFTL